MDRPLDDLSVAELQEAMGAGRLSARQLTEYYLDRIHRLNPQLHAVIETNPEALEIAEALDKERQQGRVRGPLHGIPVLLKDNIDTADAMATTAGSLALVGSKPRQDATVASKLRQAGAVLLGKANMSEWANFRSTHSSSGWSGRGGQCRNPHALDRSPGGSSSGSGAAIAAAFAVASLGTETDGSIISPANNNGVVGIKPTLGLTSRAGVIPIAHSQDVVGPLARSVADAAAVLSAIAGPDGRDPATADAAQAATDYTRFLRPDALHGARIGVPRERFFGNSEKTDVIVNAAIAQLKALGAEVIDPADIPTAAEMRSAGTERIVLHYEFKADLNAYLAGLGPEAPVHSLEEVIRFNEEHRAEEMPYFGQEILLAAQEKGPLTEQEYLEALATNHRLSRTEGIDAVMQEYQLDALVAPSGGPAWTIDLIDGDHHIGGGSSQPTALAGYPAISIPAGYTFGMPVGISFMGRAWEEGKLLGYAYALEQALQAYRKPTFRPTAVSA